MLIILKYSLKNIVFIISFLLVSNCGMAQHQSHTLLEKGKKLLSEAKTLEAEDTLRKAFSSKEVLPDELCYYYGIALAKNGKLEKALQFFEKYESLSKGTGSLHTQNEKAIAEIGIQICTQCKGKGTYLHTDTCKVCKGIGETTTSCTVCKGTGKVSCSHCLGQGVIKQSNGLTVWYKDCSVCNGSGFETCKRCLGTLKHKEHCSVCKGKKVTTTRVTCKLKHVSTKH